MKWFECVTIEELKSIGTFTELKAVINFAMGKRVKITSRSWGQLFEDIKTMQQLFGYGRVVNENEDDYFKSGSSRYIFILVELDGKTRQKCLGVNLSHYKDRNIAKKWMNNIVKQIHPDVCNHPKAKVAAQELEKMYNEMIDK